MVKTNLGWYKIKLRRDESMILYPSIKRAKSILNWQPRINLEAGLRQTILQYKKKLI